MNISDKQLTALMKWVRSYTILEHNPFDATREQEDSCRRDLCAAFGFAMSGDGRPVVPQSAPRPVVVPPELYAPYGGPTTERQQAEVDDAYEDKASRLTYLAHKQGYTATGTADFILQHWIELKAIMEPVAECCNVCNGYIGHVPVPGERCQCCDNRMGL